MNSKENGRSAKRLLMGIVLYLVILVISLLIACGCIAAYRRISFGDDEVSSVMMKYSYIAEFVANPDYILENELLTPQEINTELMFRVLLSDSVYTLSEDDMNALEAAFSAFSKEEIAEVVRIGTDYDRNLKYGSGKLIQAYHGRNSEGPNDMKGIFRGNFAWINEDELRESGMYEAAYEIIENNDTNGDVRMDCYALKGAECKPILVTIVDDQSNGISSLNLYDEGGFDDSWTIVRGEDDYFRLSEPEFDTDRNETLAKARLIADNVMNKIDFQNPKLDSTNQVGTPYHESIIATPFSLQRVMYTVNSGAVTGTGNYAYVTVRYWDYRNTSVAVLIAVGIAVTLIYWILFILVDSNRKKNNSI